MCLIVAKNLLWSLETSAFPPPRPNSLHPCPLNSGPSPSISLSEIHHVIKAQTSKALSFPIIVTIDNFYLSLVFYYLHLGLEDSVQIKTILAKILSVAGKQRKYREFYKTV